MGQLGVTGRMKTTNFTLIEAFEIGIAKIASGTWHNLALTGFDGLSYYSFFR